MAFGTYYGPTLCFGTGMNLRFRSFLKDPDFIHQRLHEEQKLLEPTVIEALLNSNVNLNKVCWYFVIVSYPE